MKVTKFDPTHSGLAADSLRADKGNVETPSKAYLIAHIDVSSPQKYALYKDAEEDAFARYGGRYLVRGGKQHSLVGDLKSRTVVIEFEDMATALEFYNSPENQGAKSMRLAFATADAVLVEGCKDD